MAAIRASAGWGAFGLEASLLASQAGHQTVLLAEVQGVVVGTVTASFATGWIRSRHGHISDLVVAPAWRRRGIGSELLRAAEEAIRRRGLVGVTLDVEAGNAEALRLYLHRGYRHLRPVRLPWGPGHTLVKPLVELPHPVARRRPLRWNLPLPWARRHGAAPP